jgi:hypothetical protein
MKSYKRDLRLIWNMFSPGTVTAITLSPYEVIPQGIHLNPYDEI